METIHLEGRRFINERGSEVILHGVNVLCRSKEMGHLYPDLEKDLPWFRQMGFDLLRFGIFWDAAEPEPGRISSAYLEAVKSIVNAAEKQGLYIILDMHQDLFAQKFIDGAPDWACLDDGLAHPKNCSIWYEAYLKSDAIIRAADSFWANRPAADGIGLIDHYASMWEEISRTFADCPNVIGFEPMNEPFMGSLARSAFGKASAVMMEKDPHFNIEDPAHVDPVEAAEFMQIVAGEFLAFDSTVLMDFYRRMAESIRKGSSKAIITGGNIYCSTDIPTGIGRIGDIPQIFAPHGYDSVVDSDRYESFSRENVERIYLHKKQDQERLDLPVIIGEWGAFPSRDFTNDLIRHMNGILEQNLWGDAYCEYRPGMDKDPNFTALSRAYPMETAGTLLSYHYEESQPCFEMALQAENGGTTRIYCPFTPAEVTCSIPADLERISLSDADGSACIISIKAGQNGHARIQMK